MNVAPKKLFIRQISPKPGLGVNFDQVLYFLISSIAESQARWMLEELMKGLDYVYSMDEQCTQGNQA